MRECLGWITNCPHEHCPMNWLERSVTEIPSTVHCHVCERDVELVADESEVEAKGQSAVAACPVVPCIALSPGSPSNGKMQAKASPSASPAAPSPTPPVPPPQQPASSPPPPPPPRPPPARKAWSVTLQSGEVIKLEKDTMIIGRSRTCDVVIASAKVSRQHASLTLVDGDLFMEDLGSANGVWTNGEKINRVKINAGDTFTISDETLTFNR